ncbi:MAG: N-formylglutamate amidohydrolase [bacterium]|nr:N-formylglutamate amidohydrolase [bacterium]
MENQEEELWKVSQGDQPILATAVHSGHKLRRELLDITGLKEADRFREEDPFTDHWAKALPTHIIPYYSRFEVDLNRSREEAFYEKPEDAWGLSLWKKPPSAEMVQRSLGYYDSFYSQLKSMLDSMEERFGHFVVLDLHSYNHRRGGPEAPPEDPSLNPEVNLGTGTMDRNRWAPLVDRFLHDLRNFDFMGRKLDVRENIKFVGRNIPGWVHRNYSKTGCALAIEFKKFFMDEWSGEPDWDQLNTIRSAVLSTIPGLLEELKKSDKN